MVRGNKMERNHLRGLETPITQSLNNNWMTPVPNKNVLFARNMNHNNNMMDQKFVKNKINYSNDMYDNAAHSQSQC